MKDSGMRQVTVHGCISSVTWLEKPPFNAEKVRGVKYYQYEMELDEGLVEQLANELEDVESVWHKDFPIYERELPHPAYAGIVAAFKANPKLERQLQLGSCHFGPELIDEDECQEFAELQIEKLIGQLEAAKRKDLIEEAEHILSEVQNRGGDAYAEYKPRLQELLQVKGTRR